MSQFVEVGLQKWEGRNGQTKERRSTSPSDRKIRAYLKWFERESAAFERMRPKLLRKHLGEFVAMSHQKLVDSDQRREKLLERVLKRFKAEEIYIERVLPHPPRLVEIDTMES